MYRRLLLLPLLASSAGCLEQVDNPAEGIFGPQVKEVVLEVDYQAGAEPWTGPLLQQPQAWELAGLNLGTLFEGGTPRRLIIPQSLEQMDRINLPRRESYSRRDIWDIAERHRDEISTTERRVIYVVFLDGSLREDDGEVRPQTLGISLRDRGVIGMFTPATRAVGMLSEQTALVHELGHALGMVDIGLPLASPHHDSDNGAHCDNPDCVMYRFNCESAMRRLYYGKLSHGKKPVLFCEQCLMDVVLARGDPGP